MKLSLDFPCILTHKFAINKTLTDLMRPLFDSEIRPNRFQKMICELHAKEHMRQAVLHEYNDEGKIILFGKSKQQFSVLFDKIHYDGIISNAKWFTRCYSKFLKSVRKIYDNIMKMRPTAIVKLDVAFKGCKIHKKVRSQKVVDGTVTIKN